MRRFLTFMGVALFGCALLPSMAQAQPIVIPQGRLYTTPPTIVVVPPPATYYVTPGPPTVTAYSSRYGTTLSFYPSPNVYAVPAPITYAAPTTVLVQPSGHYQAHTTYGHGILRPRGYSTQLIYRP